MESDVVTHRGKLMEEAFFRDHDEELLEKIRNRKKHEQDEETLSSITGIQDIKLLDALTNQGITAETLTALNLIPLVSVAWADHIMNVEERDAILKSAVRQGISTETSAYNLLKGWLQERPPASMILAWKEYIRSLRSILPINSYSNLKEDILLQAENVAKIAGGFLGFNSVSDEEKKVIEDIRITFES